MAPITQESLFEKFAELDVKTLMVVEVRDKLNGKMRRNSITERGAPQRVETNYVIVGGGITDEIDYTAHYIRDVLKGR